MIVVGKYPARSGHGRIAVGHPAGERQFREVTVFLWIFCIALSTHFEAVGLSGRIRPNPAGRIDAGLGRSLSASALESQRNLNHDRSAVAPIRPYPASGAYGQQ